MLDRQSIEAIIFDDTLLHQSFNETDQLRYCLFVDMIRPTPFPLRAVVSVVRLLTKATTASRSRARSIR